MLSPKVLRLLLRVSCVLALIAGVVSALVHSEQLPVHFWDKAEHALGTLFLTCYVGMAWQHTSLPRVAMVMIGYGIMIELLQLFTPWRDASVLDALADACGALPACWLLSLPLIARWRSTLFKVASCKIASP